MQKRVVRRRSLQHSLTAVINIWFGVRGNA